MTIQRTGGMILELNSWVLTCLCQQQQKKLPTTFKTKLADWLSCVFLGFSGVYGLAASSGKNTHDSRF